MTGYSKEFRQVSTPFLPEDQNDAVVSQPAKPLSKAGKVVDCPWCRFSFDPSGSPSLPNPGIASTDVGTSGVTPAGPTPAPSGRGRSAINHTPHPSSGSSSGDSPATKQELGPRDQNNTEQEKNGERQLHIIAANILMNIMYGARFARPDLLRAVCVLARRITKWDDDCDKRLLRLVAYINSTLHYRLKGWIGDPPGKLEQHYFSDADFAGCLHTQRSTTGAFAAICGPNSMFPTAMMSRRQTCVSHSTPEAELVAMDTTLRVVAMPTRVIWDVLSPSMKGVMFW